MRQGQGPTEKLHSVTWFLRLLGSDDLLDVQKYDGIRLVCTNKSRFSEDGHLYEDESIDF